mmetsp:Transcript_12258/g.24610  ORF Transcript_12258/g.24610 Transcript_12258/m.24610 type:complete len:259 (-) Transcript_12258:109-885(-)
MPPTLKITVLITAIKLLHAPQINPISRLRRPWARRSTAHPSKTTSEWWVCSTRTRRRGRKSRRAVARFSGRKSHQARVVRVTIPQSIRKCSAISVEQRSWTRRSILPQTMPNMWARWTRTRTPGRASHSRPLMEPRLKMGGMPDGQQMRLVLSNISKARWRSARKSTLHHLLRGRTWVCWTRPRMPSHSSRSPTTLLTTLRLRATLSNIVSPARWQWARSFISALKWPLPAALSSIGVNMTPPLPNGRTPGWSPPTTR